VSFQMRKIASHPSRVLSTANAWGRFDEWAFSPAYYEKSTKSPGGEVKKLGLVMCLLLGYGFLEAQTLVELAKKEKERRKENVAAGKKVTAEAEGGGTPPVSREELKRRRNAGTSEAREEEIGRLQQDLEDLKREIRRTVYQCRVQMYEAGYQHVSDLLTACAEIRKLDGERKELEKAIEELKAERSRT